MCNGYHWERKLSWQQAKLGVSTRHATQKKKEKAFKITTVFNIVISITLVK